MHYFTDINTLEYCVKRDSSDCIVSLYISKPFELVNHLYKCRSFTIIRTSINANIISNKQDATAQWARTIITSTE